MATQNRYYSNSTTQRVGMDTRTGQRNVAPDNGQKITIEFKNANDSNSYLKPEYWNQFSDSIVKDAVGYSQEQQRQSFIQQRNIIQDAGSFKQLYAEPDQSAQNWNAKQWDDKIKHDRTSAVSGGSGGDEISWANTFNRIRMTQPGGGLPSSLGDATDAYNRRMREKMIPYTTELTKVRETNKSQERIEQAKLDSNQRMAQLELQNSNYDRESKERIAQLQADAQAKSAMYSSLGGFANRQYNWQYWG